MVPRAPKREGFINWRTSEAREVIMEALLKGDIPLDETKMSTEEVWRRYRFTAAFIGPPAVQFQQFKERLRDHRKRFKQLTARMEEEELGFAYDLCTH